MFLLGRLTGLLPRPFKVEFGDIFDRLKRHTEIVDRTAVTIQLQRAAEFREGENYSLLKILTSADDQTRDAEIPIPVLAEPTECQSVLSNSTSEQVAGDLRLD